MGTLDVGNKVGPGGQHYRPLCHKITDQHLYPNSSEKIRNHLAEAMLYEDSLYFKKVFQLDLNDGSHLDSSIQLLKTQE